MSELEQRIKRLEDRAAIDDLVVRYFLAADGDDMEGVGNSFTTNATFSSSGTISGTGRDGIVAFIASSREHMGLTLHTPNYSLYTFIDDDHATGLIGAHLELVLGGKSILGAVRYEDSYVREASGWLISSRDMRSIFVAPWDELEAAMRSDKPVQWPGGEPTATDFPRR